MAARAGKNKTPSSGATSGDNKRDRSVPVAIIGATALVITGIITMLSPTVQEWLKPKVVPSAPALAPVSVTPKMKDSYCNDERTGQPYSYEIPSFYPKNYTDLSKPFGGDAANPGHLFTVRSDAPGFVLGPPATHCRHDGSSEGITYCGPDQAAKGQPTKTAVIQGWINGEGGPTYMTVAYQLPCKVLDSGK